MKNILVVCSGNTCRSPMAAALLATRLGAGRQILAAGTAAVPGSGASALAIQVMGERGLDLGGHRARILSRDLVEQADLVLTMTRAHRQAVLDLVPGAADRTFTLREYAGCPVNPPVDEELDISDPLGRGLEVYQAVAGELERLADEVGRRLGGGAG
ncbi:MAG: low molecular weight protein arginine phosphatase [bacterium]|nr:low molecular weight protein arginine phosphatase [bacterium]